MTDPAPGPEGPALHARLALFAAGDWHAVPLRVDDAPALQAFYDANPGYFMTVEGQPPAPDAALETITEDPPPGFAFRERHVVAFVDSAGTWAGMASFVRDFVAPSVWHLGLFVVATPLQGRGVAAHLHAAWEDWAMAQGARWLRLGVVAGNVRAEAFWRRRGYRELRVRRGLAMGARVNDVRVMVKPLPPVPPADAWMVDYLARVARDRPDAP